MAFVPIICLALIIDGIPHFAEAENKTSETRRVKEFHGSSSIGDAGVQMPTTNHESIAYTSWLSIFEGNSISPFALPFSDRHSSSPIYTGLRKIPDTLMIWPDEFLMEIRKHVIPGIMHFGSWHPSIFYAKLVAQLCNWCFWYSRMNCRDYSTNSITKVYRIWRTERPLTRNYSIYHTTTPISRDNYGEFYSLQDQWGE